MKPIAVFYHTRVSGGLGHAIDPGKAMELYVEQLAALQGSGLLEAARVVVIGNNGSDADTLDLAALAPPRSQVIAHGPDKAGELPTLHVLRQFCESHPNWLVFYHHAKGVTYPANDGWGPIWRGCMTGCCVWNWRQCVKDLDSADSVGAHWLTRERYGGMVHNPFWGGNFWWVRSEFVPQLRVNPVTATNRDEMFLAESWIGSGRRPMVVDYAPHWPNHRDCLQNCV